MSNNIFLKRLFQAYYQEKKEKIPTINSLERREFGFIPWEKPMMIRHLGFGNYEYLKDYLVENGPRHVFSSGALYLMPENQDMEKKEYQGCDFLIDIDVDHFYTPCKDNHDLWYCKECGKNGKGMANKCPKCGSTKLENLNWICDNCLDIAKKEIFKLIDDFLIPDFGFQASNLKIAYSGHRGYHIKIDDKRVRALISEERREIVDYLTGDNISFEVLGLQEVGSSIYGLMKENLGWSQKIVRKIEEVLQRSDDIKLQNLLLNFGLNQNAVKSFLNSKNDFLQVITHSDRSLWNIEGFGMKNWTLFLNGIVKLIGAEIDQPVSIDIHRLIRYPGSLNGKTGFKVQELSLEELENFDPFNETNEKLDPIVFSSAKLQKIEIVEQYVPETKLKDKIYGPYIQGEKTDVPHHVAVYLLCKEVARTI